MSCPTAPPTGLADVTGQISASVPSSAAILTNREDHSGRCSSFQAKPCFRIFWTKNLIQWLSDRGKKLGAGTLMRISKS